ncbi:MAG: putative toxin-antitoxin system toxin component, PIN family [Patescibacteria group bacterium]
MSTGKENNLIKAVLDTNILISALFFGGKPREIFDLILEKEFIGITSPYIIFELKDVLRRKKFDIDEERIEEAVDLIKEYFEEVNLQTKLNLIKHNHPDNKILALAIDAKADYLITGDKQHLLPLKKIKKTKIVSAEEFLLLIS